MHINQITTKGSVLFTATDTTPQCVTQLTKDPVSTKHKNQTVVEPFRNHTSIIIFIPW